MSKIIRLTNITEQKLEKFKENTIKQYKKNNIPYDEEEIRKQNDLFIRIALEIAIQKQLKI